MVKLGQMLVPVSPSSVLSSPVRVARIAGSGRSRRVWVVELKRIALPYPLVADDVEREIVSDTVKVETWLPRATLRPPENQSERAKAIQTKAWARIEPLVGSPGSLDAFFGKNRPQLLRDRACEVGCELQQVYRDIHRFFANGMTPAALYPTYRSVEIGTRQSAGEKRGVKRRDGVRGITVIGQEREDIRAFLQKVIGPDSSIDDLYHQVLTRFYSKKLKLANSEFGRAVLNPAGSIPSKAQFLRIYAEANAGFRLTRKQKGTRVWRNDYAPALGRTHKDLFGPGARYEIDSTGTQVELTNRDLSPLGPASIYLVIDTWSNLIVGYFVGLGAASWDGAKTALYNAFLESKVDLCAHYGITIAKDDWPGGIPYSVISDWGSEFIGKASDNAVSSLGIAFTQGQSGQCRERADGERTNGTIKTQLLRHLVGSRPKFNVGRGSKDPKMTAGYTIHELNVEIIRWILDFNRHQPVTLEALPVEVRGENVVPTRLPLWNWGMRSLTGGIRSVPASQLYSALLPRDERARFAIDGLHSRGFRYTAGRLEDQGEFSRVRLNLEERKPRVHFNVSQPDRCYLWDEEKDEFLECERISGDYPDSYSEYDVNRERQRYADQCRAMEHERLESSVERLDLQNRAQRRALSRVAQRKELTGRKTAKDTTVREERAEAVHQERMSRAREEARGYAPVPSTPKPDKPRLKSLSDQQHQADLAVLQSLMPKE